MVLKLGVSATYLEEKENTIKSLDGLSYCGEEDLLAHYLLNYDETENRHYIGTREHEHNFLMIGEGEWDDFTKLDIYDKKIKANEISYCWDRLIQKTCQNTLDGTILGYSSPLRGKSAIHEMAKEPRFHRRFLSERIIESIESFPETPQPIMRNLSFLPSFYDKKGYVFLQLKIPTTPDTAEENRQKRQALLEIACGSAKNKFPDLTTIIGIAIYSPKYATEDGEDFILLECEDWPDEHKKHFDKLNEDWGFFQSSSLNMQSERVSEFPE